jgi:hypothetical protein
MPFVAALIKRTADQVHGQSSSSGGGLSIR